MSCCRMVEPITSAQMAAQLQLCCLDSEVLQKTSSSEPCLAVQRLEVACQLATASQRASVVFQINSKAPFQKVLRK